MIFRRLAAAAAVVAASLAGCGGAANDDVPVQAEPAQMVAPAIVGCHVQARFLEGAPELETLINGTAQSLGDTAFLTVNGQTVSMGAASGFSYGWLTPFVCIQAGVETLKVTDSVGYFVGPLKTTALKTGGRYTVVIVGTYPHYRVLSFTEPAPGTNPSLSVYQVAPSSKSIDFGTFVQSRCGKTPHGFKRLGSAKYGSMLNLSLGGKALTGFGAYVGTGTTPIADGTMPPCTANPFDRQNDLPFENATRLSLFLLDPNPAVTSRLIGYLDE